MSASDNPPEASASGGSIFSAESEEWFARHLATAPPLSAARRVRINRLLSEIAARSTSPETESDPAA